MKRMSWAATAMMVTATTLFSAFSTANASPLSGTFKADTGVANPASAGVINPDGNTSNGGAFKFVNVTNPDNLQLRTATGGVSSSEFVSFCIELTQNVSNNTYYTMHTIALDTAPVPNPMTSVAAELMKVMWYQQITTKLAAVDNPLNDSIYMAAFQMALWELVYDPNTSLSSGTFKAANTGGDVAQRAQLFLNEATTALDNDANTARANLVALRLVRDPEGNFQNQVIEIVPEPASVVAWSLIGGCFIVGHRIRRRHSA
jgi:hypothetical protein